MSGLSSFLNKTYPPSTPTSTPPAGASSTPTTAPPQPSTQPAGPSAFSGMSTPSLPTQGTAGASGSSGSSAATLRLREIAQQSQKLNDTIRAGSAGLPKLELSLGMIRDKARDMSRRAGGAGRDNMQQAYLPSLLFCTLPFVLSFCAFSLLFCT